MSRPNHSTIDSSRLHLVPATVELIQADLEGPGALAASLGVTVPADWPPELFTRLAMLAMQGQLADRAEHGWSTWYLVGRGPGEGLVGVCGFKLCTRCKAYLLTIRTAWSLASLKKNQSPVCSFQPTKLFMYLPCWCHVEKKKKE